MTSYVGLFDRIGRHTVIEDGLKIVRSGGKHPKRGIRIGRRSYIFSGSCFVLGDLDKNPYADFEIGDYTYVNWGCYISGEGGLKIGNRCLIGPNVCIMSAGHKYRAKGILIQKHGRSYGKIEIEDDVWIGGGSQILEGAKLHQGCVVASGSVVKGEFPPYAVMAGNPAKIIKSRG